MCDVECEDWDLKKAGHEAGESGGKNSRGGRTQRLIQQCEGFVCRTKVLFQAGRLNCKLAMDIETSR
jgi:hypothetical protein